MGKKGKGKYAGKAQQPGSDGIYNDQAASGGYDTTPTGPDQIDPTTGEVFESNRELYQRSDNARG